MPLVNNESGNFISIYGGKIARRVPEGSVGAVTRTNKIGKVVHERYYDSFVGKLIGIKTMDGSYGKQWLFSFNDGAETYILTMPYDSGIALAFLAMLPNIDVTKEMKVSAGVSTNDKGVESTSLFVNQGGVPIKHYYTKNEPNGMPAWNPVTVNGNTLWDKSATLAFLEEMLARDILPKLPNVEEANAPVSAEGAVSATEERSLDDIFGDGQPEGDQVF
jgi:hypothetical protein